MMVTRSTARRLINSRSPLVQPRHRIAFISSSANFVALSDGVYHRRFYSSDPAASPKSSKQADPVAPLPPRSSGARKKIDLHPPPRKPDPADLLHSSISQVKPHASADASHVHASTSNKAASAVHEPGLSKSDNGSVIQQAVQDMREAQRHGILDPPPEDAGRVSRLWHQGKQLFKFYLQGIKLIAVHRRTVKQIKQRVAAEKAAGREAHMTRWESQFVKLYNEDIVKLIPFLMIVAILEEIIPLVVMYAPGLLPSTCILPSQLERIQRRAEGKRQEALLALSSLVKQTSEASDPSPDHLERAVLQPLCRAFGLATWGPAPLLRRRLTSHLGYLRADDALLQEEESGKHLSFVDLRLALWERAYVLDGVPNDALQRTLAKWVRETGTGKSPLSIVLSRVYKG